jgi:hypothetical protein
MSVITLNQSAMMRKPFRIVLTALSANQIRNLFSKAPHKMAHRRTHTPVGQKSEE